jgi:hypothetical protein
MSPQFPVIVAERNKYVVPSHPFLVDIISRGHHSRLKREAKHELMIGPHFPLNLNGDI